MKKFIMMVFAGIASSYALQAGTYTFTNRSNNGVFLNVCAATCNCQTSGEISPGQSHTFHYGGCCLDYVKISDAIREYDFQTRPGWGNGVDRDPGMLIGQIRCGDGSWNIELDSNSNFTLKGY